MFILSSHELKLMNADSADYTCKNLETTSGIYVWPNEKGIT